MSATYNWAYKPGVINKYGLTIPSGADNVRPTGWVYVALYGNDATGNGSRQYPYRTLTKAFSLSGNTIVLGSGVYREGATIAANANNIVGDGDVVIDISYITYLTGSSFSSNYFYNFRLRGNGSTSYFASTTGAVPLSTFKDIIFDGAYISAASNYASIITNCLIINFSGVIVSQLGTHLTYTANTWVNCNNIQANDLAVNDSSVFYYCNISAVAKTSINFQYSLFFGCYFKLSALGSGGPLYPAANAGYTYYASLSALQAAYATLYGGTAFYGCAMSDPLFNNAAIGDYSLSFSSPAKNLSYFGTYVGAKSIAYAIKASATESSGSFDFSTNVNLTVANDSIVLTDPSQNAEIKTKLIVNATSRQIQKFPLYGFNADRNGQYIDSIADLSGTVKNAGDTLGTLTPYLVEVGAITYNSVVYQPGDRFTTVSGSTTFTTSSAGTCREILEAPERHTIMMRCGDSVTTISAGTPVTSGYWYYVASGSVVYNSVTYNSGSIFKGIDTNSFTGTGVVIVALSTEVFQHYEPGIQPTSNNVGDARTGAIIRGNGDPAYVRGGYGVQEFPISSKFIQLYYIINVSNLKP